MSPLQTLAPDQRAVLELLLRQGRSYAQLSELLGLPEDAVRDRAHAALAALAPDRAAPVGEDGAVADWILGQAGGEAASTRDAVSRMPAWRAWAAEVVDRLNEVEGAKVPDVPPKPKPQGGTRPRPLRDGNAAATKARDGGKPARPRRAPEPAVAATGGGGAAAALRSSRLGGAILIGVL